MAEPDRIAKGLWWDQTWRLTRGCSKVSDGCDHCWAEREAHIRGRQGNQKVARQYGLTDDHGHWTGEVEALAQNLHKPLHKRKPNWWAIWNDPFHPSIPFEFIAAMYGVMAACKDQVFCVLTKRPERRLEWHKWITEKVCVGNSRDDAKPNPIRACGMFAQQYLEEIGDQGTVWLLTAAFGYAWFDNWPLRNVIEMTSVEGQPTADERLYWLMRTPAAWRGVSVGPMLDQVWLDCYQSSGCPTGWLDEEPGLDWVIVEAESGPSRRRPPVNGHRSIRDRCVACGVPFFLKQWPDPYGRIVHMPKLDGRTWDQKPEVKR